MTQEKIEAGACCARIWESLSPELFRAMSDPNRVSILAHLAKSGAPQTVTDVTACCPVDYSVVSRHLKILKAAGAVTSVKQGKAVLYTLQIKPLVSLLRRLADALEACCPGGSRPDEIALDGVVR